MRKKAKKGKLASNKRISRREWLRLTISCMVGVSQGVFVNYIWDRWKNRDTGRQETVNVNRLFKEWNSLNLFPGQAHPQYGYHPDILDAQDKLIRLFSQREDIRYLPLEELPSVYNKSNLLLIGGPFSNEISRNWRRLELRDGYLRGDINKNGLRWEFYYPYPIKQSGPIARYVGGKEVGTSLKFIVDNNAAPIARERCAMIDEESGRLKTDYLLITYIPNVLSDESTGSAILDVSDLHGQGDRMFADIIEDSDLRNELFEATIKKRWRYFQALYEVAVDHDDIRKYTYPYSAALMGVFKIA